MLADLFWCFCGGASWARVGLEIVFELVDEPLNVLSQIGDLLSLVFSAQTVQYAHSKLGYFLTYVGLLGGLHNRFGRRFPAWHFLLLFVCMRCCALRTVAFSYIINPGKPAINKQKPLHRLQLLQAEESLLLGRGLQLHWVPSSHIYKGRNNKPFPLFTITNNSCSCPLRLALKCCPHCTAVAIGLQTWDIDVNSGYLLKYLSLIDRGPTSPWATPIIELVYILLSHTACRHPPAAAVLIQINCFTFPKPSPDRNPPLRVPSVSHPLPVEPPASFHRVDQDLEPF